jgi:hypothetical protein
VPTQTLLRLIQREEAGVFGPDDFAVMTAAFDQLVFDLKLTDPDDPVAEMVARLVIELVRNGERDPERLRQRVLSGRRPES